MKIKELIKLSVIVLIVVFLSLYFTTLGGYYEYNLSQKNVLTEEAIARFEEDVKAGKEIIASNYIEEERDYSNKFSRTTLKISNFVSSTFTKTMKYIFKQLSKAINE